MSEKAVAQIMERLLRLPEDRLAVVRDFVEFLIERQQRSESARPPAPSRAPVRRDWDDLTAEEVATLQADPEAAELAEGDMQDYRSQLEAYEQKLARGEIR